MLFDGPVDTAVDDALAADVLAVLREALSNVARHASASRVEVRVTAGDQLEVRVRDDGVGPPLDPVGGHGLANMDKRAEERAGTFELARRQPGGTEVIWRVPLR